MAVADVEKWRFLGDGSFLLTAMVSLTRNGLLLYLFYKFKQLKKKSQLLKETKKKSQTCYNKKEEKKKLMDSSCHFFAERHKFKTETVTENELVLHTPVYCEAFTVLFL